MDVFRKLVVFLEFLYDPYQLLQKPLLYPSLAVKRKEEEKN